LRIISLLPSATEILFALGLGDDIVGVTFECNHPIEALTKRIVSTSSLPEGLTPAEIDTAVKERMAAGEDLYRLDEAAFADLDPDLVITQDLCAVCAIDVSEVSQALHYLGCSADVLTLDPMTLDEVIDTIPVVGAATGTDDIADTLTAELGHRLQAVANKIAPVRPAGEEPKVMVIEWADPAFTAGHWVPDLVLAAGGQPVLAFPGRPSSGVEWDAIESAEADIVIVAPCGFDLEGSATQAQSLIDRSVLPAKAEVWAVDADAYVVRPGPRLVDGVETFATIFHPEYVGLPDPQRARRLH